MCFTLSTKAPFAVLLNVVSREGAPTGLSQLGQGQGEGK